MTGPIDVDAVRADEQFVEDLIADRTPGDDDLANHLAAWVSE